MKAACIVAHPDDCAIFGYQFIADHADWDWQICYLIFHAEHPRVQEMASFWNKRGISVIAAGFGDDMVEAEAERYLQIRSRGCDVILTHNSVGEYGEATHKFIHGVLSKVDVPKVYFGTWPDHCNHVIELDIPAFDASDLPIHKTVIEGFDLTNWKYLITPEAQSIVKYTHERSEIHSS